MNKLAITKEQFMELYPDMMPYYNIFVEEYKTDKQLLEEYMTSKLWRMNNLYTIIDKDGDEIPFIMNYSQYKVYAAWRVHARLIILKSRQQGISTLWLIDFFDNACFSENLNIGLMAQGADEAATLLIRVKTAWDKLDPMIKDHFNLAIKKDNTKEFSLTNGSTIFIRTSFRSTTLQNLHISEFGKIANKYPERAKETNKGTLQAIKPGNTVVIESTAEGDNMFKEKWDAAVNCGGKYAPKDMQPVFLSWLDDPDCYSIVDEIPSKEQIEYFESLEEELNIRLTQQQKNFWIMQYRELGDDIYQEYPATPEEAFTISRDGTYYANSFRENVTKKKRIVPNLYDANLDVTVVMDLGMNDDFFMGFWQIYNKEVRCIDEHVNSGEGLEYYARVMKESGYKIDRVIVPHDAKVKELSTGQSRVHAMRKLGVRRIKVLPRQSVNGGIEAVRRMIPNLWIDESCTAHIGSFRNYSKEWDDHYGVWKDRPNHNKWSHGADQIRYRAVSLLGHFDKREVYKGGRDFGDKRNRGGFDV